MFSCCWFQQKCRSWYSYSPWTTGSVVKWGHAQHLATIQHRAWKPLSSHSSDCPKSKRERRPSPSSGASITIKLAKNCPEHISYFFFPPGHVKPSLSVSVCSCKLQGSAGVEITSSRHAEGKGSFSWGSLLLNFQTGSICRIQHFICHSPGKLLQHNWAGLIECSSKWPFKSLFSTPNFHFSWSFTTILMIS